MQAYPTVILPGIGQSKVNVVDGSGKKVKSAFPPQVDTKGIIGELKGALVKMMLFRKDGGFSDKVAGIARDVIGPLACGPDGKPAANVRAVTYEKPLSECTPDEKRFIYKMVPMEELGEAIGEDNLFYFAYNPFGNLFDTAEDLNRYIAMVKERTGSDKVNLVVVSISGVLLRAYLMKYGADEFSKIVNVVSALDGTSVVADAYERKLRLDNPVGVIKSMGGRFAQFAEAAAMVPANVMTAVIDKCYEAGADMLLRNSTIMWGAIPRERFAPIFDAYLKNAGKPELEAQVTAFNEYDRYFSEHALAAEAESGVRFYQLCGYDLKLMSVIDSENESSDGMINVASASFGAKQVSAGEEVTAEGCVFPDRTWFFKGQQHDNIAFNDAALALVKGIILGEVENVESSHAFPQFNGFRNVKKLKYTLVPRANELLQRTDLPADIRTGIKDCLAAYAELLDSTFILANDAVRAIESKLSEILDKVRD